MPLQLDWPLERAVAVAALPDVELAVVAVVALPASEAVMVPALKLPDPSRNTIWLAVFVLVAVIVALLAWLVMDPAVVADVAVLAFPLSVAVIVPAEKLPEPSRSTIWLAVLLLVAVMVALLA